MVHIGSKALTKADKKQLEDMLKSKQSKVCIAKLLNVNEATIYREIKRGLDKNGIYCAEISIRKAEERSAPVNKKEFLEKYYVKAIDDKKGYITRDERLLIEQYVNQGYSARQLATVLGRHQQTIYRELRRGKTEDGMYSAELAEAKLSRITK